MHEKHPPSSGNAWPTWQLALLFYPFVVAAVAINLFMLGLMLQALGYAALSPVKALGLALPLGLPLTWLAGRWIRRLVMEAQDG